MAQTIEMRIHPPAKPTLVLPKRWYPGLSRFQGYDVIHADVPDAMVAVLGYRVPHEAQP